MGVRARKLRFLSIFINIYVYIYMCFIDDLSIYVLSVLTSFFSEQVSQLSLELHEHMLTEMEIYYRYNVLLRTTLKAFRVYKNDRSKRIVFFITGKVGSCHLFFKIRSIKWQLNSQSLSKMKTYVESTLGLLVEFALFVYGKSR